MLLSNLKFFDGKPGAKALGNDNKEKRETGQKEKLKSSGLTEKQMRTAVHNQKAARRKATPAEEQAAGAAARAEKAAELFEEA